MGPLFALAGVLLRRGPLFHTTWASEIWSESAAHKAGVDAWSWVLEVL